MLIYCLATVISLTVWLQWCLWLSGYSGVFDCLATVVSLTAGLQWCLWLPGYSDVLDCLTTVMSLTVWLQWCLWLSDYSDVFDDDRGCLPGVAHFLVNETVTPVASPACRVPHTMKSKVKAELEKLTEREIIAPVEEPTSWCSRMVVATKKSGKLRICID